MSEFALTQREDGAYLLTRHGRPTGATMRANRRMRSADIEVGGETVPAKILGFGRQRLLVGTEGAARLELGGDTALLAGQPGPLRWEIGRNCREFRADLSAGDARITVRLPAFRGTSPDIEVSGRWPDRDLVVLSICLALMSRHRRAVAIMAATGSAR